MTYDWISYIRSYFHRRPVLVKKLNCLVFFRIVLMPGTEKEQAYSFPTTQVREGRAIGNVPVTDNNTAEGKIDVKFVLRYCHLKEK